MQTSPYEIALIAGGFTIIGVLIGAWVGYRNALKLHNIIEFNKAAAAFRNAFLPEIAYLRYDVGMAKAASTDSDLAQFLKAGLVNRHIEALGIFRAYLSNRQKRNIDKAWQEYQTKADSYKSKPMLAPEKEEVLKRIEAFLDEHAPLK